MYKLEKTKTTRHNLKMNVEDQIVDFIGSSKTFCLAISVLMNFIIFALHFL